MAKAIIKAADEVCWCVGCMAPNGEIKIDFDGTYDRKPYCLCKECFTELVAKATTVAASMGIVEAKRYNDSARWSGLRDKRVECETITSEEFDSGKWITRVEATNRFCVVRQKLDRYRRLGKIQARKMFGTETYRKDGSSYPQGGYLYNVDELKEKFEENNSNNC